jgi:hypothetical protein
VAAVTHQRDKTVARPTHCGPQPGDLAAKRHSASNIPRQIRDFHLERIREGLQCPKGDVAFSALQFPDVCAVQPAHIPENVLG